MKELPMLENNSFKERNKKSLLNNPDYFISQIETSNIQAFTGDYEEQILKDETLETNFNTFKWALNILYEAAELYENNYKEEIEFLSKYIDKIFNSIKDGNKDFKSIFLSDEDKNRFYKLLKEYFTDSFTNKLKEIERADPNFKEPPKVEEFKEITQEQIDKWLDMDGDSENEK